MIVVPNILITWKEFEQKFQENFGFHCVDMKDIEIYMEKMKPEVEFYPLMGWEAMEDTEILDECGFADKSSGELYVITEISYKKECGPFKIEGQKLKELVAEHLDLFGECFFSIDVLIVSFSKKEIFIFHHEGVYATLNMSEIQGTKNLNIDHRSS